MKVTESYHLSKGEKQTNKQTNKNRLEAVNVEGFGKSGQLY